MTAMLRRQSGERAGIDNDFWIGLFGANCSGGLAVTTVEERWTASWAGNLEVARMADEGGLDFLLPIARWLGFGGSTHFQSHIFETITWATGLLAATRSIRVFATVHSGFFHPVIAAKQLATADQISGGRAGLNIVAGWNKPEYEMFGLSLPQTHDDRYDLAREWLGVVEQLWTATEPADFNGKFFQLRGLMGDPKPLGRSRLPIISAGGSPQGQAFAQCHADILFTTLFDPVAEAGTLAVIKADAAANDRPHLRICAPAYVVCRDTDGEAAEYHHHYAVDHADEAAVDRLLNLSISNTKTISPDLLVQMRTRLAGGHGGLPLVGSPDTIAASIKALSDAGIDGLALSFVNYETELPRFIADVLPRMERDGIRPVRGNSTDR